MNDAQNTTSEHAEEARPRPQNRRSETRRPHLVTSGRPQVRPQAKTSSERPADTAGTDPFTPVMRPSAIRHREALR